MSSPPGLKSIIERNISNRVFRAEDYVQMLRKNVEAYIDKYFYEDCRKIFDSLKEAALEGESLTANYNFIVPKELNTDVASEKLLLFFKHQGYNVVLEPSKDRNVSISLRL